MDAPADPLSLPAAVRAFDAMAPRFDERFGGWRSVAAQRAAVRRHLLATFPEGSALLELGGGTGEDALFLAARGRRVHLTDGSPAMVARAAEKVAAAGAGGSVTLDCVPLEALGELAEARVSAGLPSFDGCYSNFAAFNCVEDHRAPARALARLLVSGGRAVLVVFGPFAPGEVATLLLRGQARSAFRRLSRRPVPARVGSHAFTVTYPSPRALARSFSPWFRLVATRGIGVFVPPSSAEPAISAWPRLLAALERVDRVVSAPLALLGDHVLVVLERTGAPA